MSNTQKPQDKVVFFPEQIKFLRKLFPHRVLSTNCPEAELREYFGVQKVLAEIEAREGR